MEPEKEKSIEIGGAGKACCERSDGEDQEADLPVACPNSGFLARLEARVTELEKELQNLQDIVQRLQFGESSDYE